MINYIAEFVGSLIFFTGILVAVTKLPKHFAPLIIGLSLTLGVYIASAFGAPGHLNPAVSVVFYVLKKVSNEDLIKYIIIHCLAGVVVGSLPL